MYKSLRHFSKILFVFIVCLLCLAISQAVTAISYDHYYKQSIPVYVITDRKKYSTAQSTDASLHPVIQAGIVTVSLGNRLTRQSINSQLLSSPGVTINISPSLLDHLNELDNFMTTLNTQIIKTPQHELLVYLHGCCEGPQDSLEEAAQLSAHCNCPVLLFDWSSPSVRQAGVWAYIQSDRALELSELYFGQLMEHLADKTSAHITIISYSMGAKLLRNYLRQFPECFIDQIHLVRPDISLPVFLLEQNKFKKQYGKMYIYLSTKDLTLQSSAVLMSANVERLGMQRHPSQWFAKPLPNTPPNTTIIDISKLHQGLDPRGHTIPFDAVSWMHDLDKDKTIQTFEIRRPFPTNPQFWELNYNNKK